MADDLQRALDSLVAIAGNNKRFWERIDKFVRKHRQGQKQGRKKGITKFGIKFEAMFAYDNAPRRKKIAVAQAVYAKHGMKVTADRVKQDRKRLLKELVDDLSEFLPDRKKGDK